MKIASGAPPIHMSQRTVGTPTTENARRFQNSDTGVPAMGSGPISGRDAAEAAVPVLIVEDRPVELAAAEVGPEHARDVELGVGELPQEEIRDALLAGRADEEVGVRTVRGKQVVRDRLFIDLFRLPASGRDLSSEEPGRANDLGSRAIRDEEIQAQFGVVGG